MLKDELTKVEIAKDKRVENEMAKEEMFSIPERTLDPWEQHTENMIRETSLAY